MSISKVVLAVLLTTCLSCTRNDLQERQMTICYNQADRIWCQIIDLMTHENVKRYSVEDAVKRICEKRTIKEMKCDIRGSAWMHINPDSTLWNSPSKAPTDIAVYCAEPFFIVRTGRTNYVGITFAGQKALFTNAPQWKPVPVWEYSNTNNTP